MLPIYIIKLNSNLDNYKAFIDNCYTVSSQPANANFNELVKNGTYTCVHPVSNSPNNSCGWMVYVFGNGTKYCCQLALPINNSNWSLYYRTCQNGTWDGWRYCNSTKAP